MNQIMCEKVIENKSALVPSIFTEKQVALLEKYVKKQKLEPSEKTYIYSTINKKLNSLACLQEEFYVNGANLIPERVEEAKKILKGINRPAFISGSFLFSEKYNDIDVFIISNRRKQ